MWAMTPFGILMPAIRPLHTVAAGDKRTMQIRSRRAKDLDILRARYMLGQLGKTIHTPSFDYEYRAYCVPEDFAAAMAAMVMEINYKKFKPTTEDWYEDADLHDCYNSIWATVLRTLSDRRHKETVYSRWPEERPGNSKAYSGGYSSGGTGWGPYTHSTIQPPEDLAHGGVVLDRDDGREYYVGAAEYVFREPVTGVAVEDIPLPHSLRFSEASVEAGAVDPKYAPDVVIAAAWAEIDEICERQETRGKFHHERCDHSETNKAKKACERDQVETEDRRIGELRLLIDATKDEELLQLEIEAGVVSAEVTGSAQK